MPAEISDGKRHPASSKLRPKLGWILLGVCLIVIPASARFHLDQLLNPSDKQEAELRYAADFVTAGIGMALIAWGVFGKKFLKNQSHSPSAVGDDAFPPDGIPNEQLRAVDVPVNLSDWETFALTFNGHRHFPGHKAALANTVVEKYKTNTIDLNSLTLSELRGCLFFEQRRYRWAGITPPEEVLRYIHALLSAIRAKVT